MGQESRDHPPAYVQWLWEPGTLTSVRHYAWSYGLEDSLYRETDFVRRLEAVGAITDLMGVVVLDVEPVGLHVAVHLGSFDPDAAMPVFAGRAERQQTMDGVRIFTPKETESGILSEPPAAYGIGPDVLVSATWFGALEDWMPVETAIETRSGSVPRYHETRDSMGLVADRLPDDPDLAAANTGDGYPATLGNFSPPEDTEASGLWLRRDGNGHVIEFIYVFPSSDEIDHAALDRIAQRRETAGDSATTVIEGRVGVVRSENSG